MSQVVRLKNENGKIEAVLSIDAGHGLTKGQTVTVQFEPMTLTVREIKDESKDLESFQVILEGTDDGTVTIG